jgi:hypothetical protein
MTWFNIIDAVVVPGLLCLKKNHYEEGIVRAILACASKIE